MKVHVLLETMPLTRSWVLGVYEDVDEAERELERRREGETVLVYEIQEHEVKESFES